jgi:hypothetical protein
MDATLPTKDARSRSAGRGFFWAGLGLCVVALALVVLQYRLNYLGTPWYLPILTSVGALLLVWSIVRRGSIPRILALVALAVFAGLQWLFLTTAARLPDYAGPAQAGTPIPAFQTTLADGRPFTEQDLRDGRPSVLVFFRGRW